MSPGQSVLSAAALLGISIATIPAVAHHGWAGQAGSQIDVAGKVHKVVNLAGPHATMEVIANGQVWEVTLAPPARTRSAGLTSAALKVGDSVVVRGNRNADPKRFEIKTVRVTAATRIFDIYPDRLR
jgi:Family of unknown function (DUF6152)